MAKLQPAVESGLRRADSASDAPFEKRLQDLIDIADPDEPVPAFTP